LDKHDIFLSYARADSARVVPLVRALEAHGWRTFWDQDIPIGETWLSYIGAALHEAPVVLVVWSQESIKSSFVYSEARHALQRHVLVPVLIDAIEPPLGLDSINAADLTKWVVANGVDPLPDGLISAIESRIAPGTKPEPIKVKLVDLERGPDAVLGPVVIRTFLSGIVGLGAFGCLSWLRDLAHYDEGAYTVVAILAELILVCLAWPLWSLLVRTRPKIFSRWQKTSHGWLPDMGVGLLATIMLIGFTAFSDAAGRAFLSIDQVSILLFAAIYFVSSYCFITWAEWRRL